MALDTYLTKTIAVGTAGTFYPTGVIVTSGSAVDEIDTLGRIGLSQTLAVVVIPGTAPTGTSPTLQVEVESDDNTSFSSAISRFTAARMNGTSGRSANGSGPHLLGYITGPMERYVRFKLTAAGTSPNFGTVTCALTPDWPYGDLV